MSICAFCCAETATSIALCPYHHSAEGDGWAATNRIMCDFLHRKKELPPRLSPDERDGEMLECVS